MSTGKPVEIEFLSYLGDIAKVVSLGRPEMESMSVGEIALERTGPIPFVDDDLSERVLSRSTMALGHEKPVHYIGRMFVYQETPMSQGRRWFEARVWLLNISGQ